MIYLPLLWVVVGRPEPHLMHMFSRVDFPVICEKHQLLIDSDTREDVRLYLRDGFDEIGAKFLGVQGGLWPSAEDFEKVLKIADGLFALASAMMNYVGDVTYANPAKRLRDLMAFMEPADHLAIDNPLATLDLLYSRILAGIPPTLVPIAKLLLFHIRNRPIPGYVLCDTASITFDTCDSAIQEASIKGITVYHASFYDYLNSSERSGRFYIQADDISVDHLKIVLFWCQNIWKAHASDGSPETSIIPQLIWPSAERSERVTTGIDTITHLWSFQLWAMTSTVPPELALDLLSLIDNFDFRYMPLERPRPYHFLNCVNWLFTTQRQSSPRTPVLRAHPLHNLDQTLLDSLAGKLKPGFVMKPMVFPVRSSKFPHPAPE
ncbi:hypothetical protein D9756_005155 [Leucocoprinus leucothites]|uniref:Uncharacterized protein n=1 Tax=Leucocoprinus leucothites TaxID=201217 RepID=A0A8H5G8Z6_9AGAR|nr:hypothetical protein D9756_005155 [Leucoagaricus leucothites]